MTCDRICCSYVTVIAARFTEYAIHLVRELCHETVRRHCLRWKWMPSNYIELKIMHCREMNATHHAPPSFNLQSVQRSIKTMTTTANLEHNTDSNANSSEISRTTQANIWQNPFIIDVANFYNRIDSFCWLIGKWMRLLSFDATHDGHVNAESKWFIMNSSFCCGSDEIRVKQTFADWDTGPSARHEFNASNILPRKMPVK